MSAHGCDPGLAHTRGLSVAQHRAVSEERDLHAVAFDDRGRARFRCVASGADHLLAHAAE
jgi:hypothetical protein